MSPNGVMRQAHRQTHEYLGIQVGAVRDARWQTLQLQGIAARLLKRWDEAASLFRRVTELRSEYLSGWLELTWALASLRRFEEAERVARTAVDLDPDGAAALGNLAAVLLEQNKIDEARVVADKAFAADPADSKNQAVLAATERAARQGRSWWRRLLSM